MTREEWIIAAVVTAGAMLFVTIGLLLCHHMHTPPVYV